MCDADSWLKRQQLIVCYDIFQCSFPIPGPTFLARKQVWRDGSFFFSQGVWFKTVGVKDERDMKSGDVEKV